MIASTLKGMPLYGVYRMKILFTHNTFPTENWHRVNKFKSQSEPPLFSHNDYVPGTREKSVGDDMLQDTIRGNREIATDGWWIHERALTPNTLHLIFCIHKSGSVHVAAHLWFSCESLEQVPSTCTIYIVRRRPSIPRSMPR